MVQCSECGKEMKEEEASYESNYCFCSYECHGRFVGVLQATDLCVTPGPISNHARRRAPHQNEKAPGRLGGGHNGDVGRSKEIEVLERLARVGRFVAQQPIILR
jgi:hypothetical protein